MDKKTIVYKVICTVAVVALAVLLLCGVFNGKDSMYHLKNRGDLGPLTRQDINYVTVTAPAGTGLYGNTTAADWKDIYPEITASMLANKDNKDFIDYLEKDPYLKEIYEGYGFAKDYGSARGHEWTLVDIEKTLRPHATANCMTCKTPDFAKLVQTEGVGVYKRPFDEVFAEINAKGEPISCYTCHGDDAGAQGALNITHTYVNKALGDNAINGTISPSVLSCGQCHIEYYFTVEDAEAMMPYSGVETMTPEAILAYYDSIQNKDGELGFYDWVQPGTGTHMLKAQHPEMETFLSGKHAKEGLSCADCHMAIKMTDDGNVYFDHELVSPLDSPEILATCAQCHGSTNMVQLVHGIQNRVTAEETKVGNNLAGLKKAIIAAIEDGTLQEGSDKLEQVRKLHREAQWFFDFCYVENAEGAHNSELAAHCLEVSQQKIDEALALIASDEAKP